MWPDPQETADLVAFTEEILNWNFIFLCSESGKIKNFHKWFWSLRDSHPYPKNLTNIGSTRFKV